MKKQAKLTLLSLLLLGGSAVQAADNGELSGAALIKKGEQIAISSDCQACHTKPEGGTPFAGGYGISSPMGVIYATNITQQTRRALAVIAKSSLLVPSGTGSVPMAPTSIPPCPTPLIPG